MRYLLQKVFYAPMQMVATAMLLLIAAAIAFLDWFTWGEVSRLAGDRWVEPKKIVREAFEYWRWGR